ALNNKPGDVSQSGGKRQVTVNSLLFSATGAEIGAVGFADIERRAIRKPHRAKSTVHIGYAAPVDDDRSVNLDELARRQGLFGVLQGHAQQSAPSVDMDLDVIACCANPVDCRWWWESFRHVFF